MPGGYHLHHSIKHQIHPGTDLLLKYQLYFTIHCKSNNVHTPLWLMAKEGADDMGGMGWEILGIRKGMGKEGGGICCKMLRMPLFITS